MKHFLLILALLLCAPSIYAQNYSGTISALNDAITGDVGSKTGVGFQLNGTCTAGVVNFEASVDGTTYVALSVTPPGSSTSVTTTAAAGAWKANGGAYAKVRMRVSDACDANNFTGFIKVGTGVAETGGFGGGVVASSILAPSGANYTTAGYGWQSTSAYFGFNTNAQNAYYSDGAASRLEIGLNTSSRGFAITVPGNTSPTAGFGFMFNAGPGNNIEGGLCRADIGVMQWCSGAASTTAWIRDTYGSINLTSNYTNATTTFSNTVASFTLKSGKFYPFTVELFLDDSTAADGVKIDFNGGSAAATDFRVHCSLENNVGGVVAFTAAASTTLAGVINAAAMTDTNQHWLRCAGRMVPSADGTFILRAAQNAHTTGTLTIRAGSNMWLRDSP